MMLRDLGLVLDKESADLKVLAYSQINSDVKIAFDCSWDREIESSVFSLFLICKFQGILSN